MDGDRTGAFDDTLAAGNEATDTQSPAGAASDAATLAGNTTAGSGPPLLESWPSGSGEPAAGGGTIARYQLEAVIGRGGMGEVVSARDEQIGRSVAIKRLRVRNAPPDVVARFVREARIQGRLDHPAVVPVHELWRDANDQPFFVMKQLSGTTLADVLVRRATGDVEANRKYSRQRLLRAFVDVCLAVEFAHTRGVVHRDLKPANVMLGDFGEVYVLDWGIARVVADGSRADRADRIDTLDGDATSAGSVLGTPGYMPAEQVRGDADLDGRADVYALGCILFEILAGQPLHPRGQAALATALAGVDGRPSIRMPADAVPPELDSVCAGATTLDRDDRLATARELGDAVQRFLDGDRDVALRAKLAGDELDAARAALARGGAAAHRAAMRAAARALALDPTAREAADLVGRLMLEPPAEVPREVEDELAELDVAALHATSRLTVLVALAYLALLPVMYWVGFRETWFVASGVAIAAATAVVGRFYPRRWIMTASYCVVLGQIAMVALLSRVASPFLLAPGIAAILVMTISAHPRLFRAPVLVLVASAAVLAPWFAEVTGALSRTMTIVDNRIVMQMAATEIDPRAALVALPLYVVVLVAMAAIVARSLTDARRTAQRAVQIQAWQLRQLVPATRAGTDAPAG